MPSGLSRKVPFALFQQQHTSTGVGVVAGLPGIPLLGAVTLIFHTRNGRRNAFPPTKAYGFDFSSFCGVGGAGDGRQSSCSKSGGSCVLTGGMRGLPLRLDEMNPILGQGRGRIQ